MRTRIHGFLQTLTPELKTLILCDAMDAKDILGLPKTAFPGNQERKSRTPKEPQRKPDGVSREVVSHTNLYEISSKFHLISCFFFLLLTLSVSAEI